MLALRRIRDRRVGESLQFDNRRGAVDAPEVDHATTAGNTAWQGQHLCFGRGMVLRQLDLQCNLVAAELRSFLVELGRFCAGSNQFAAQFAIATLQHLKETNVLKTFGMEFFPGPPGIGGLLGDQRGSGNPDFAPGEETGQEPTDNRDDETDAGHPDPTKSHPDGDDGRPEQRESRVTA